MATKDLYLSGNRYTFSRYAECLNCDTVGRCMAHDVLDKQFVNLHTTLYRCSVCGARWYTTRLACNSKYEMWRIDGRN